MSVIMNRPLQEYGTGDALAGALAQYSNYIVEAYYDALVVTPHIWSMPIPQGTNALQFPATAKASGSAVEPGVLRVGANQPEVAFRTIALDAQEWESDRYVSLTDQFITHYPYQQPFAAAAAKACAEYVEDKILRMVAIGARQAAHGTGANAFPAGSFVASDTTTSTTAIATNYPVSLSGALAFEADIDKLAYTMDTKSVPKEGRVLFCSWYMYRVLLQDKTLLSHDFQAANDMLTRRMVRVGDFFIQPTNRMPSADDTSNTDYPAAYRVQTADTDAAPTANTTLHPTITNANTVALAVGGKDSVGQVVPMSIVRAVNPEWIANMNAFYMGAKTWDGSKWLRPEACGEIVLSG